jgi:F0F1-type ATP synthase assembly protein I
MDFGDRRELYNGFGDGLSRAFELAVTPLIFGFFGWLLDRWIGTLPVFTLTLGLLTLVYMFIRMWWAYDAKMKSHEGQLAELRHAPVDPNRINPNRIAQLREERTA